jgi:preprotein translocase subunit Sec61beta
VLYKGLTEGGLQLPHTSYLTGGKNNMANDKISMPSSGGGLIRYFEDYKSKISLKPGQVIVLVIAVMIIIILLHTYGGALLK